MLLSAFVGLSLLRFAHRALLALLFQLPPRSTRLEPFGLRPKAFDDIAPEAPAAAGQREGDQGRHAFPLHAALPLRQQSSLVPRSASLGFGQLRSPVCSTDLGPKQPESQG